jgi:IS5 family transposase
VIAARRLQRNFADGFIAEAGEDLWEPWMRHADQALEDDALLLIIQQEWAKRCKKRKTGGRKATPADVVLRMLLLKHVRDWSYETLSREVRAKLVYREFTRIGGEKVPDDRTMGNLARQLGPEVIEKLHRRGIEIAQQNKIATGRKRRVDTTVVETDIHYRMSRVKLVYSAGGSPARARVRGPVAWIVRRKETESRKSIDKAILGMVSESSGRNASKRTGGPENVNPRGRALGNGAKAAWNVAI